LGAPPRSFGPDFWGHPPPQKKEKNCGAIRETEIEETGALAPPPRVFLKKNFKILDPPPHSPPLGGEKKTRNQNKIIK